MHIKQSTSIQTTEKLTLCIIKYLTILITISFNFENKFVVKKEQNIKFQNIHIMLFTNDSISQRIITIYISVDNLIYHLISCKC